MTLSIFGAVPRLIVKSRATFIQEYPFPAGVRDSVRAELGLSLEQSGRVLEGLRQYFLACLSAQATPLAREVGMPSKAVDAAWHAFILSTREYAAFCRRAFGRYLHHAPPGTSKVPSRQALVNTLHQFRQPPLTAVTPWIMVGAVPLLFAIDRELGIPGGSGFEAGAMAELNAARLAEMNSRAPSSNGSGGSAGCGGFSSCSSGCSSGGCGGGGCGGQ